MRFEIQAWELLTGELEVDRVVDLRIPERYQRGHMAGALNIPYAEFQARAAALLVPGETVLLVDPGGARAAEMAIWLRGKGFRAGYLVGGMAAWPGEVERG